MKPSFLVLATSALMFSPFIFPEFVNSEPATSIPFPSTVPLFTSELVALISPFVANVPEFSTLSPVIPFPAAILLELVAFFIFLASIVSLASSFPELSMFPPEILPIAVMSPLFVMSSVLRSTPSTFPVFFRLLTSRFLT